MNKNLLYIALAFSMLINVAVLCVLLKGNISSTTKEEEFDAKPNKERLERGREHPIDLARDIVKRAELWLGENITLYSDTKKDEHPTRLQTSVDAQAVQRDAHLSGTKVEINSKNRAEIAKGLSSLAEKMAESKLPTEDF